MCLLSVLVMTISPAKWLNRWRCRLGWTGMGSKNYALDRGPDSHTGRSTFQGRMDNVGFSCTLLSSVSIRWPLTQLGVTFNFLPRKISPSDAAFRHKDFDHLFQRLWEMVSATTDIPAAQCTLSHAAGPALISRPAAGRRLSGPERLRTTRREPLSETDLLFRRLDGSTCCVDWMVMMVGSRTSV